jgi:hypothetical protein
MAKPTPPVPYIALRPWHILSDVGRIIEVQTEKEAQVLRDDGYIVLKHPVEVHTEDDGA